MANTELPPVPYKTPPVGQDGMLTQPWMAWFRQLFTRVGQNSAPSNSSLFLSPMSAIGDLIYGGIAGAATRLAGNATTTKKFLTQSGDGSSAASPGWNAISAADIPTLNQNTTGTAAIFTGNLTGDVTSVGMATTIGASSIAASKLVGTDIATVGTITSGTWSGTTIALNKGGTGQTTKAAAFDALSPMSASGDVMYGGTAGTGTRLPKGSDGQVLTLASGLPSWASAPSAPTGLITMYGAATAPTGYLLCDGAAVSRTTYAALFTAISTTYGSGDGSTTFNVPNLKGVFPRGAGSQVIGGITYAGTLGATQGDTIQGHKHNGAYVSTTAAGGGTFTAVELDVAGTTPPTGNPITDGTNGTPRTGTETRPANVGVTFIIKT